MHPTVACGCVSPAWTRRRVTGLRWAGPVAEDPEDVLREASRRDWDPLPESGPLGPDATITGAALGTIGVRIPRCHPETIRLIEIVRV